METINFLRLVLPERGVYCWVTIKDKKAKQGFVSTIEELAQVLKDKDAQGLDVYFACASFLTEGKRTNDNALGAKAFWLDIDAGPGKPYADADAAVAALDEFCKAVDFPYAMVVCSGNGIHAWWPLDRTIETKEWKEYAARFKRLCETHGFNADPTRTADISSILRAPGTRNFKQPEEPKSVFMFGFEDEADGTGTNILSALKSPAPVHAGIDIVGNWDKLKPKENEVSLTEGFPDGKRTHALEQRAGLLLGPKYNYTLEQTVEALAQWNLLNTPPLAPEKIITTAISIQKRDAAKRAAGGYVGGNLSAAPRLATDGLELPLLPFGYKWSDAGRLTTQVEEKNEDGEQEWVTVDITEFPLYLLSVTRKEREQAQAYIFMFKLPHEEWKEFQINCLEFEGKNWKAAMSNNTGHCILSEKLFKNYVHKADSELRRKQMDAVRYQQFGWKEDDEGFLVGDTMIKLGGKVERVWGGDEIAHRMKQMAPRKGGSLDAWTKEANLLFSDQFLHLGYALVASFATPLLRFAMGESDGGFVLSITSPGSGKGKTRTIEAATSVWGELESLQITPRDTLNAQMAIVTSACHLPVFMDEWNEKDAAVQAKFLRQLTVGHDKNRAQRDGTVKSKPASYKTLLITTSNHSIYDIMNMINDEAAAARVVEVLAPEMDGEVFKRFNVITTTMLKNSGYAGREFIFQLMQPGVLTQVRNDLLVTIDRIREHLHTEGKHRYITVLPAAILVTANLLVKHGILEFDVARLVKWSFEHVQNRVKTVQCVPADESLTSFLFENVSRILMVDKPGQSNTVPCMVLNNGGNIPATIIARHERETRRLYLVPSFLRSWCLKHNVDFNTMSDELEREGILLDKRKRISLAAGTTANYGRAMVWELNMALDIPMEPAED